LIIRDRRDHPDVQEIVLMVADFSFTPPEQILAALKKGGNMPGMGDAASAGGMVMNAAKPDLNDVTYDVFLANDRMLGDPEVIRVEPGRRVLLRIINSSSMSAFHIDLGEINGELTLSTDLRFAGRGRRFPCDNKKFRAGGSSRRYRQISRSHQWLN
jgi:hypothetical protein